MKKKSESDKRTAILNAALNLFAENGFHGAPALQIAEKAGVGVGSLYRYFKDKEDLIHQLFKHIASIKSKDDATAYTKRFLPFNYLILKGIFFRRRRIGGKR